MYFLSFLQIAVVILRKGLIIAKDDGPFTCWIKIKNYQDSQNVITNSNLKTPLKVYGS
jgi:hypothetical protein